MHGANIRIWFIVFQFLVHIMPIYVYPSLQYNWINYIFSAYPVGSGLDYRYLEQGFWWILSGRQIAYGTNSNKWTNKMQIYFTNLLPDVYVWLNMFRASPRPSSGAYNCTRSLWFYRLERSGWNVVGPGLCDYFALYKIRAKLQQLSFLVSFVLFILGVELWLGASKIFLI
jgi:hypothetical protein